MLGGLSPLFWRVSTSMSEFVVRGRADEFVGFGATGHSWWHIFTVSTILTL